METHETARKGIVVLEMEIAPYQIKKIVFENKKGTSAVTHKYTHG
jgi:hypothetical protein